MDRVKTGGLVPPSARTFLAVVALGLAFPRGADCAQTDATTSAAFLKLPVGARNAAMGATGAAESSAFSLFWNPAGLASLEGRELAFSYASWLADTSYQFLGYAQKTSAGTFGGLVQYVSIPAIQKYDNTGAPLDQEYRPLDSLAGLSYARSVAGISVGAVVKGIYSKLDDRSAQTMAADAGIQLPSLWGRKLSAGLSVQNMGAGLKFDQERAPLPLEVRGGASYAPFPGVTFCLDVNKARGADAWVGAGFEYMLAVGPQAWVGPRAGYESDRRDLGGLAGLTTGIGLTFGKFSFDYAFVPMGDLGDTHRVSLKVGFR